jgi:hypothetical protein
MPSFCQDRLGTDTGNEHSKREIYALSDSAVGNGLLGFANLTIDAYVSPAYVSHPEMTDRKILCFKKTVGTPYAVGGALRDNPRALHCACEGAYVRTQLCLRVFTCAYVCSLPAVGLPDTLSFV